MCIYLGSVLKLGLKSCKYSFELPRSNNFSTHIKKTVFVSVSIVLRKEVLTFASRQKEMDKEYFCLNLP